MLGWVFALMWGTCECRPLRASGDWAGIVSEWQGASWMESMSAPGACPLWPFLPLSRVALPGSHDSGAYALPGPLAGGLLPADVQELYQVLRRVAPGDAEELDALLRRWGVTQRSPTFDVGAQLRAGIRYLDLRACLDESGVWRGCHALYGDPFQEILQSVASFLDEHRGEAVVVEMAVVGGVPQAGSKKSVGKLEHLIVQILGDHIHERPTGGGEVVPSLAALVASGRRCVILMDPPPGEHREADAGGPQQPWPFWPVYEHVVNTWPDAGDVQSMVTFNTEAVNDFDRRSTANESFADRKFFKLTFVLTATGPVVVDDLVRPRDERIPHTLVDLADAANAAYGAFADKHLRNVRLGGAVLFDNIHPEGKESGQGAPLHPVVRQLLGLHASRLCV